MRGSQQPGAGPAWHHLLYESRALIYRRRVVGWAIAACANLVKSTCTKLLSGFRRRSRSCWGSSTGCGRSSKLRCAVAALLRVSAVASVTVPDVVADKKCLQAWDRWVYARYMHDALQMHCTMHCTMHAVHRCMLHRELTMGMASRSHCGLLADSLGLLDCSGPSRANVERGAALSPRDSAGRLGYAAALPAVRSPIVRMSG